MNLWDRGALGEVGISRYERSEEVGGGFTSKDEQFLSLARSLSLIHAHTHTPSYSWYSPFVHIFIGVFGWCEWDTSKLRLLSSFEF